MSKFGVVTRSAIAAAGLLVIGSMAAPASALTLTLFSDDFNRSNSNAVGNGWSEIENSSNDVRVRNNRAQLRDSVSGFPDAAIMQLGGINTRWFDDITLSYDWAPLSNSDSSDRLFIQYRDAAVTNTWTTAVRHALGGSGFTTSLAQLLNATNVQILQFRFATRVSSGSSGNNEGVWLDNVVLSGNHIPEPGTLGLLGLGLLGAGIARRRKTA